MSDKNTFQLYGQSFQSKIIALLLTDKGYLEQIQDILESKYFENRANRWIIKNTLRDSSKANLPPLTLKYADYNQLVKMVKGKTEMYKVIKKIITTSGMDWVVKSQKVEEVVNGDVYTSHVYNQLRARNIRQLNQGNDSTMGWSIGAGCACRSAPKCCIAIAALIIILL